MSSHVHRPSANPRSGGLCDCGHMPDTPQCKLGHRKGADGFVFNLPPQYVDRDPRLERQLTDLAARSAGFFRKGPTGMPVGDTGGLDEFADRRAWPGGVRVEIDADREAQEELADARHYLVWGIQQIHADYLRGDSEAGDAYGRRMRALGFLVAAWHALAGSTRVSG